MSKFPPGPLCQGSKPVDIRDGTNALTVSSTPGTTLGPDNVSFEIGSSFVPVRSGLPGLNPAEIQVLSWLRENQPSFVKAEQTFRIDRRAIAGAIAWEMLENVKASSPISVGPGKVHIYEVVKGSLTKTLFSLASASIAGDRGKGTIAQEAEELGFLPRQSYENRVAILATPSGAITYIAGMMAAIADLAGQHKFDDIRSDPVILTNVYQSKTLTTWKAALSTKTPGTPFAGGNPMDRWVSTHLAFLEDGVGSPHLPESVPIRASVGPTPPKPSGAVKSVIVKPGDSLSGIARAEYGDVDLWPLLYDLNKAKVGANPNLIPPGLSLSVAPLSSYTAEQISDAKRRAPSWKSSR